MTELEIWIYLVAAFAVGLGLGWWLFHDSGSTAGGSAAVAKDRAKSPRPEASPPEPAAPPAGPEVEALEASLEGLRTELVAARKAHDAAEQERARAERDAKAERGRLERLQGNLDQTRQARDTYKAEVERAKRTIQQLERAADEQRPTASLSFDDDEATEAAPSIDDNPPEAEVPEPPEVLVSLTPSVSLAPTARVPPPPPPPPTKRRPRGPFDVLFGPLGGVPLTTNARSIPWELTIRLHDTDEAPSRLSDVQVTLRFDLEDEGVSINGRRRGPITLSRGGSVTPSRPLHVQVSVSTGYHSDTPESSRPPAITGDHAVIIAVQYQTDRNRGTPDTARFSARIPVVPSR